jgi:aromatic ring-opening dioxygenase LigB subunit
MSIAFAAISPHPPILLPEVGSEEDRAKVKKTIDALEILAKKFKEANPEQIIISSPHPDWGFNVPLYFVAKGFQGEIKNFLTEMLTLEPPSFCFGKGKEFYSKIKDPKLRIAIIASGDLSHCLKTDGPYGFHPDGPEFDKNIVELLKKSDVENILKLEDNFPNAGECGLRSFCFLLGILEAAKINWQPEILSYEGPFGVGYLVANFKLKEL